MPFPEPSLPRFQHGFSLVEIMVAMVIGMFGVVIMMQMLSISESQKRNVSGAGDAQNAGAIALYGLQRDVGMAGYGITMYNLLGCNMTMPSGVAIPVAPVVINPATAIVPAGDPNSDRLLVSYGSADAAPQGNTITTNAAPTYTVSSIGFVSVNDYVFTAPAPAAPCAGNLVLDRVTVVNGNVVTVATGAVGTTLYNLGKTFKVLAYAVRDGNLTVCDYVLNNCGDAAQTGDLTRWVPVAANVVSLLAQYGRDNNSNVPALTQTQIDAVINAVPNAPHPPPTYFVDTYDQTTPTAGVVATPTNLHPTPPCGWARIPAVRLALTVRNAQYEKDVVTLAAPAWEGSATLPIDASKNPDGTVNADWGHFRYKVFQTTVPLHNVAWMGVQAGC
ncbi:MAG: PilW family protein [Burkholderiales bacterium]